MLVFLGTLLAASPSYACGGFFCSSGGSTSTTTTQTTQTDTLTGEAPVTQKSERILFSVDREAETITAYVEVAYVQNEEVDFAWIIPLPAEIAAEDVTTINADFFNALELETAPRFKFTWEEINYNTNSNYNYNYYYQPRAVGCAIMGCSAQESGSSKWDTGFSTTTATTTTASSEIDVAVIDEAVVGPFAIEIISAQDTLEFATWLGDNGYDLPEEALEPLEYYVDNGSTFLGVKLAPDIPEGPIETLVFTYSGIAPMIPIMLTRVAVCPNLPIVAYILADEPWGSDGWTETESPALETRPNLYGIDYAELVSARLDQWGGHAFIREFGMPTDQFTVSPQGLEDIVNSKPYLTRLRGELSPHEMNEDPDFRPYPGAYDVTGQYEIEIDPPYYSRSGERTERRRRRGRGGQGAWLLLPLLGLLRRWHKR